MISNIPESTRNLFKTGTTEQDFILIKRDENRAITGWFSALDGDFTSDGVTIEQNACEGEDLVFGGVLCDTISFDLINDPIDEGRTEERILGNFTWGEMQAYAGVKVEESPFLVRDVNCQIDIPGGSAYGKNDGFYLEEDDGFDGLATRVIATTQPVKTILYDSYAERFLVFCESEFYIYNYANETTTASLPFSWHLAKKMRNGLGMMFSYGGATSSWHMRIIRTDNVAGTKTVFDYVTLGTFIIEKPKKLQYAVISIDNAFNVLHNLDKDATEMLNNAFANTDEKTSYTFLNDILSGTGIMLGSVPPDVSLYGTVTKAMFRGGSYTLRTLAGAYAEMFGTIGVLTHDENRTIVPTLSFVRVCNPKASYVETVGLDRIAAESLDISSVETPYISRVILRATSGETIITPIQTLSGTPGDYDITGNPLVSSVNQYLTTALTVDNFVYHPMGFTVINADPCIEIGDSIRVEYYLDGTTHSVDAFGNVTDTEITLTPYVIPLLRRVLRWQGTLNAEYEAPGESERYAGRDSKAYADSAMMQYTQSQIEGYDDSLTQSKVFNRLTNGGASQGLYLDTNTGMIYLNAEYIQSGGVIAGTLYASDLRITGGSVNIQTSNEESSVIDISYGHPTAGETRSWLSAIGLKTYKQYPISSDHSLYGAFTAIQGNLIAFDKNYDMDTDTGTRVAYLGLSNSGYGLLNLYDSSGHVITKLSADAYDNACWELRDGSTQRQIYMTGGSSGGVIDVYDSSENLRAELDQTGVVFKDASGNGTASYPATGFGVTSSNSYAVSCANNTVTNLMSVTLSKGRYIFTVTAHFGTNATGYRRIWAASSASATGELSEQSLVVVQAANGQATRPTATFYYEVTTATKTIYINAKQTSGSTLTTYAYLKAIKLP